MIRQAAKFEEPAAVEVAATDDHIAPAPRVSVQAFCETVETAAAIQSAGEDRRLGKAHLKIQMGGMAAAAAARCWLRHAKASWSAREMAWASATFSAVSPIWM